jgi:hypothetical protein
VIDDDQITWVDIATGWDVTVISGASRLSKLLNIDTLANLGSPTIGGTNEALSLDFQFQKSNGLDVYVDGVLWDEKGNNPQETTADIEFRDNTSGDPVLLFRKPTGEDDNSDAATMTMHMRKAGNNLFSSVTVPWSWLQSAAFPIEIDPSPQNAQVGASADDGSYGSVSGYTNNGVTVNLSTATSQDRIWARWTGITIDDGSTIDDSYIEFYFRDAETGSEEVLDAKFEDAANPAAPTDAADARGKTRTTAGYSWTIVGNSANSFFPSGTNSLDGVIQELEDSYDYSSGAAMQALVFYSGASGSLRVRTYDHNSANAPKLHISYTAGGGAAAVQDTIMGGGIIPFDR